jgi:hypothetical protein
MPLRLMQPIVSIGYKDRPVFDHAMALQDDFGFTGVKDGDTWTGNAEKYFMPCAPVMMEVLRWAERQEHAPNQMGNSLICGQP